MRLPLTRTAGVAVVLVLGMVGAAAGAGEARHSGTVVRVDDDELVIREMGTWTGSGSGVAERRVTLAADTATQLVRREPGAAERTSRPGWKSIAMRPEDIRPGDFVTVTTRKAGGDVAVSIEVLRPNGG
jgi:hypothetical protein